MRGEISVDGFSLARLAADPRSDVERHTHEAAHFVFVTAGAYVTSAAGAPDPDGRPILVYNPPGTTHRDRFLLSNGRFRGRFLSISIAPAALSEVEDQAPLPQRALCLSSPEALALVQRLERECRRWDEHSALVAEGTCLELLGRASRSASRDGIGPPRWLVRASGLLRDRSGDPVTVREIARECGVHPVHLARSFRAHLGCSPGDYLRRLRLERAAARIRGRRSSLAEIALDAGFVDQSHMTRTFRCVYGITPAGYRRALAR